MIGGVVVGKKMRNIDWNKDDKTTIRKKVINEVLALEGNYDTQELMNLSATLSNFFNKFKGNEDPEDMLVYDMKRIVAMYNLEAKGGDFEEICEIVAPIFERLYNTKKKTILEHRILARIVDNAPTFEDTHNIALSAIEDIKKFKPYRKYHDGIRKSFGFNALGRFLRAKFGSSGDVIETKADLDRLDELFEYHKNELLKLCVNGRFPVTHAVIYVREGIYHRNHIAAKKGFYMLLDTGRFGACEAILNEARQFDSYLKNMPLPNFD